MKKNSKFIFLILSVVLTLPAIIGLIHQGFPLTDDGNWMVIRFSAFYENLRNDQFPVRFLTRLNNGFGYPVPDFLYPLFMYLGVPIHILGFNFVSTIKFIFGLSFILSSLFSFLWLRKKFDNLSSLVGAVFYTFFPYHLFDVYKRGSVGEALSLAIVPFILWQIENKNFLLTSLGISLLILSHNTLAFLFVPLIFFYPLFKGIKMLKFSFFCLISGLLISSFFWFPAIYDSQYVVFGKTSVSDFYSYFINFKNIELLGIIFFVTLFSSITAVFIKKELKNNKLFLYSLIFSIIIFLFVLPISGFLWAFIPFTNLIQFPFRLISLLIILLTLQLGYLLSLIKKGNKILISGVFLILIYISAKPYLLPKDYQYLPDSFYSTNQDTTTVRNEYMPKWVKEIPQEMALSRVENINGNEKINTLEITPNKILFQVYLTEKRIININTIYFPGWEAYVNGQKTQISYKNPKGIITLNLNKGQNNVLVVFKETPIRALADFISLISLFTLFILYFFYRKKVFKLLKI